MTWLRIAYKNLWRRKVRSLLTILGVAIAVSVLVSLMGFDQGYKRGLESDIERMGYQVLVTAKGCPYEAATLMLKGGGGLRYMEDAVLKKIQQDPRVDKITPQLVHTVFDPDKNNGRGGLSLFMGIHESLLKLKPWLTFRSGGWFRTPDAEEVIMGYEAAELEQRNVGDKIFVSEIGKVLTVVGIFERTGTQDDGIIFVPLKTAQTLFGLKDQLTGIGIKLKDIALVVDFEEDLYDEPGIQVISMAQVRGTIYNLISSAKVMTNAVALIAIFIAVVGVLNTILMSVFERTKEIGVMRAIGAGRLDIFNIIWCETALVCLSGGILGNMMAVLGGTMIERAIRAVIPYAPSGPLIVIPWVLIVFSFTGALGIGFVAGLYPAWRASAVKPIEAIRGGE